MSDISKLPLNLYKANLGLQVKLGRLFQESGRQWIDYGYRLVNDGIVESNAEAEALLTAEDWQKLATLPAESFWRQLQQRFGDSQAVAQIAVTAQTDFARGLLEHYNVVVLPGSFLARESDGVNPGAGFVRIALVASLEECLEAAERIRAFCRSL